MKGKGWQAGESLFHADFIAQFREHGQILPDRYSGGGEHVSGDGGVGPGHEDFPAVVPHGVPSRGNADESVRHDEAHQRHDAQLLFFPQRCHVRIGGAGNGGQEVDGNGFDTQGGNVHVHVNPVFPCFSQPHDAAAAYFQPGFHGPFDRLDLVVVRVGGADVREVAAGGFQIVVVTGDARRLQLLAMLFGEKTVRGAQGDAALGGNVSVAGAELFHVRIRQPFAGSDNGVAQDSLVFIVSGSRQQRFVAQQGVFLHSRGVVRGLGAVFAVLRASAAASVDDGAKVEDVSAEMFADGIGCPAQFFQRLPAQGQ